MKFDRRLLVIPLSALLLIAGCLFVSPTSAKRDTSRRGANMLKDSEAYRQRLARRFEDSESSSLRKREIGDKGAFATGELAETNGEDECGDPDLPGFFKGKIDERELLVKRSEQIARLRGYEPDQPFDVSNRTRALEQMAQQEALRDGKLKSFGAPSAPNAVPSTWTAIGPTPIPNGQTQTIQVPVSGRVTAIDVHPTNSLIAYVGTAQGGVYRTTDGGVTWTNIMTGTPPSTSPPPPGATLSPAGTLAIGAVTIDPATTTTLWVGTGEGNLSLDSFFGQGIYRIINAQTTPTIQGPFEARNNGGNGHAFAGTSINKIIFDPANSNNMWVGNTLGGSGMDGANYCCGSPLAPASAFIGFYYSVNAQAATPTWARVTTLAGAGLAGVTDIAIDPTNANNLVVAQEDFGGSSASGIYNTANAVTGGAAATFTKRVNYVNATVNVKLSSYKPAGAAVFYAATDESSGTLRRSIDAGTTWTAAGALGGTGFCGGQCFYDIVVAVDPGATGATTDDIVYLGGNFRDVTTKLMARSDDGGATFANIDETLHADNHAFKLAPSNLNVAYEGNDGGIWRSDNVKAAAATVTWFNANTANFSATQYVGMDVHPTSTNFTIGGTQDNGTQTYNTAGAWFRNDFGDGGFAVIDQNSTTDTTTTMYHTYFNQTNALLGYAHTDNGSAETEGNWDFYGCDGVSANGITCTDAVNFYAPLVRGPNAADSLLPTPHNTIYYGSDRLYRSADKGVTNTVVSQAPLAAGVPISAIAISPQNDNVRIVGLNSGALFYTTTGSSTLTNLDPTNLIPNKYIGRIAINPANSNIAYIALDGYNFNSATALSHVWKVTNLSTTPVISNISTGLPDIPVNALAIDPVNTSRIFAGTDIGVYIYEGTGAASWTPFGQGLPRVAVFGMAIQPTSRTLRVATHGLGMYEITLAAPTAAPAAISGTITGSDGRPMAGVTVNLSGARSARTITDSQGTYRFANVDTDNFYTVTPSLMNYHFSPDERSFSLVANKTDAVFTAMPDAVIVGNVIDSPEFFIRQHYLDFLGREPDQGGFNYWSDQVLVCGGDLACADRRRINVSAAYFLSIEFQQTGGLVDSLYRASYGRRPLFAEFVVDRQSIAQNITVGVGDWPQQLLANKQAFVDSWLQRPAFRAAYDGLSNAAFVDALISHAGSGFNGDRSALVSALDGGNSSRAAVLLQVAENEGFVRAKSNEMFVMMEYFGYLRRDPDEDGYRFWLKKLNQFGGNFEQAEMVKAFISSSEYRQRFAQ